MVIDLNIKPERSHAGGAARQRRRQVPRILVPPRCSSPPSTILPRCPSWIRQAMQIAANIRVPSASALRVQLPMLIAPLAALSYPYILTGFNASVTTITKSDVGELPWLTAAG